MNHTPYLIDPSGLNTLDINGVRCWTGLRFLYVGPTFALVGDVGVEGDVPVGPVFEVELQIGVRRKMTAQVIVRVTAVVDDTHLLIVNSDC